MVIYNNIMGQKPHLFNLETYIDSRGFFVEKYNTEIHNLLVQNWVKENFSVSHKNVLRGLHFQYKTPQAKLIHCINGKILDVIVDLRETSESFGKHFYYYLKYDQILFVPEGFAHGFLSLEDNTIVEYKCNKFYRPDDEYTLIWNDPDLNINWGVEKPILSEKDNKGLKFNECPKFV